MRSPCTWNFMIWERIRRRRKYCQEISSQSKGITEKVKVSGDWRGKGIRMRSPIISLCLLAQVFCYGSERPNIVLIMADDMGYSDLGCYGGEIQTPNLDRLAENGIRYTQAYNTSKCWTTRISLLTGLYHHRSDRNFQNTALIGEVLRPAGYRTWWSGKHHAGFNPC